jgi:hypothetical protein
MKITRAMALLAVVGGIVLLAGCSGNFAPTLPAPIGEGASSVISIGFDEAELPAGLRAGNFSVKIDGVPTRVTNVEEGSTDAPVFICFVIDTTGSMSGEIGIVRDNIQAFADTLAGRNIIWGGVEFGDATPLDGPSPSFDTPRTKFDAANDLDGFKTWVGTLDASGGGDGPENPLDAMMEVRNDEFGWDVPADAIREFIVITDITAHQRGDGTTFCDTTLDEVRAAFRGYAVVDVVGPNLASTVAATAIKAAANNGASAVGTKQTTEDVDVRPLATATGGTFIDINTDWNLLDLDVAAHVRFRYRVQFVVPADKTEGDVTLKATFPGGTFTKTEHQVF